MKGIILAGGLGTRLLPLTRVTNKHLLPVYDKPMIHYPIECLVNAGIRDIMIVTGGDHAGDFLKLLGNGRQFGLDDLHYTYQEGEGGIADALRLAEHFADGDKIVVVLGDNIIEQNIRGAVGGFFTQRSGAKILLKEVEDPQRFGVAEIQGNTVIGIEEKPANPKTNYAVIGIYMFDPQVFQIIRTLKPSGRGELEITDVNNAYIAQGTMTYEILQGWWTDAGTFESLHRASNMVAAGGANHVPEDRSATLFETGGAGVTTYCVTGAAGFIGSNFVRQVLQEEPAVRVVAYDALTYAGNLENLTDCLEHERLRFIRGNICDADAVGAALADGVDVVINFAAESHVDRSILGCREFIQTNVGGVQVLLDQARACGVRLFVQVSTDEVYGSLGPTGLFTETTPLQPRSPYSASKAAADLLVASYQHTFGMPTLITRCSNNYGPYQFPEKLIPLFITNLLEGKKVPVYGDGQNVRDWIHVSDHCRGIRAVIAKGRVGEVYNLGGNNEQNNLTITRLLLEALGKDESSIQYVPDRLGHDRRYAIDASKSAGELGWGPRVGFAEGLAETVQWYRQNESWWRRIKSGEYLTYYERQYGAAAGRGSVVRGQ